MTWAFSSEIPAEFSHPIRLVDFWDSSDGRLVDNGKYFEHYSNETHEFFMISITITPETTMDSYCNCHA